jgi:diacylglycerol kinase (ATP)
MNEPPEPRERATGVIRVWRALFFSIDGLRAAWTREAAFRQELALCAVLIPIALLLPATLTQKALLIACAVLVLIVELLNSALEATVDRISLQRHELAKHAKDAASAAVLLALINLALIWAMVLFEVFG